MDIDKFVGIRINKINSDFISVEVISYLFGIFFSIPLSILLHVVIRQILASG